MTTPLEQFKAEIQKNDKPVFVDFSATWCSPCRAFGPVFKKIGEEVKGKAKFIMVDVDQGGDIAAAYGISKIPIVKIFLKGQPVDEITAPREETLRKLLTKYGC